MAFYSIHGFACFLAAGALGLVILWYCWSILEDKCAEKRERGVVIILVCISLPMRSRWVPSIFSSKSSLLANPIHATKRLQHRLGKVISARIHVSKLWRRRRDAFIFL